MEDCAIELSVEVAGDIMCEPETSVKASPFEARHRQDESPSLSERVEPDRRPFVADITCVIVTVTEPFVLYFTALESKQSTFSVNQCLSVKISRQIVLGKGFTMMFSEDFKCLTKD